jgi:sodium-dependent dicarboxylate transporter 2/3/5
VTLAVFLVTATAWITRPLLNKLAIWGNKPLAGLTDPGIAMLAALALFLIPVERKPRRFAMDWRHAENLPWGILLLFGGGLSLAAAVKANGVADFVGSQAHALGGWPTPLIVLAVAGIVIFLTEMASNTATTATLLPILAGLAHGLGLVPGLLLVPATVAASCAFMMPVATPPNAIVFGSGQVTIPQMCRAGLWLNLIGMIVVTGITYLLAVPLLGIG